MPRRPDHYWAVRPRFMEGKEQHVRIEKAADAEAACQMAFGRGRPEGRWEAKDLGSEVRVIQSDRKRIALLRSPEGWTPIGVEREAMRRYREEEEARAHGKQDVQRQG